jgi:predicted amidophosphoribosyltransferase
MGMFMAYCHNCGEKLPKNAYFCPNCGNKTTPGTETNTPPPSEEMRQAFAKMSVEIEKAFTIATKEIQAAFQTARENVQQSMQKENVVCENCSGINPGGSVYCYRCGRKIEDKGEKTTT